VVVVVESSPSGFSTGVERAAAQGAAAPGGDQHTKKTTSTHIINQKTYTYPQLPCLCTMT